MAGSMHMARASSQNGCGVNFCRGQANFHLRKLSLPLTEMHLTANVTVAQATEHGSQHAHGQGKQSEWLWGEFLQGLGIISVSRNSACL
jgi:hypothetical protein